MVKDAASGSKAILISSIPALFAQSTINCFPYSFQIAGTVTTHFISSFVYLFPFKFIYSNALFENNLKYSVITFFNLTPLFSGKLAVI